MLTRQEHSTRRAFLQATFAGTAFVSAATRGLGAAATQAFTYYVDNDGSDANSGLAITTPFRTVQKINSLKLVPGQSVGFKAGGVWREQLVIANSGSANAGAITYGSYGAGPQPIISGADLATWTQTPTSAAQEASPVGGFASGFEAPNFSDWDGTAIAGNPTLSLSATHPAHGLFCMQFTGDGRDNRGALYKNIPAMTSGSTYYFRLYIYTPSATLAANNAIKYVNFFAGFNQLGYAALSTDSAGNVAAFTLNMYAGGGYPIANVSLAGKYLMDQWNYVEIEYKTDPAVGAMQVWVNGKSIGSTPHINTSGGIGLNQIHVGNGNYGSIIPKGASIYFDDVDVAPTGPIGPASLLPATVSAAYSQETSPAGGFASGFEAPNFSDWDGTAIAGNPTLSVSAAHPAHGLFCMQFTGDGRDNRGAVYKNIPAMTSGCTYYFRLYIYTPSATLAANNALKYINFFAGFNQVGYAALNTDNAGNVAAFTLNMYAGGGYPIANVSLAGKYLMDQWNYLEVEYKTDPAAGTMQVWVNGQSIGSTQHMNTSGGIGLNQIQVGNGNYGSIIPKAASIYFDDVTVAPTGPIGPVFPATAASNMIWQTAQTSAPLMVIFDQVFGLNVPSFAALKAPNQWYWNNTTRLLYICSPGDPSTSAEVSARSNAITMSGSSYITLQGLKWRGASSFGLYSTGQNIGSIVNGCTGELNFAEGAFFSELYWSMDGINVLDSEFRNNGGCGLLVNGNFTNWLISSSLFHHNGLVAFGTADLQTWTAGLKLWGNDTGGTGTIVQNCHLYSNGCQVTDAAKGNGLWLDQAVGITVRGNNIYYNDSFGLFFEKTSCCIAYQNLIWNCAQTGMYTAGLGVKSSAYDNSTSNIVCNNVVYQSGWFGLYLGAYEGDGQARFDRNLVCNNIVVSSAQQILYVETGGANDGTNGTGNTYINNCFGVEQKNFICWGGVNYSQYSAWQSAEGLIMQNVEADPQFANPLAGDFSLKTGSPCLNAGVSVPKVNSGMGATPNVGRF